MRNIFLALIVIVIYFDVCGQTVPASFAYQAVIRDSKGTLIIEDEVSIKIEIAKGSDSGSVVFEEEHKVVTNKQGLVSLEIGSKSDLGAVNWAEGPYFIVLSVDIEGGSSYTEVGSYQLLSVPYALYAANGGIQGPKGDAGVSIKSGTVNTNGNLVLTMTDNSTKDVGNVKGPQGNPGKGVSNFSINTNGELIVTYSDNTTANLGKVKGENGNAGNYLGSATIDISNNTVSVKDNSISAAKIMDGNIINSKIGGDAVTSNKIANRTIQGVDLAQMNATPNQVLAWSGTDWGPTTISGSGGSPTGSAGGDLTGTYPNPTIGNGKIINSKLAADVVTSDKIVNRTIQGVDLAQMNATSNQVLAWNGTDWGPTTVSIGGGSPTGSAGGDLTGSYPNPIIGNAKINESKIADNAITSGKIFNSAVTSAKIQDGTIAAVDLGSMGATNGQVLTYENGWKPKAATGGSELWEDGAVTIKPKNSFADVQIKNVFIGDFFQNFPGQPSVSGIAIRKDLGSNVINIGESYLGGNTGTAGNIDMFEGSDKTINLNSSEYGTIELFDSRLADPSFSTLLLTGGGGSKTTNVYGHPSIHFRDHRNSNNDILKIFVDDNHRGVIASNIKNFFMLHPTKPDSTIWYASVEGPEAGAYDRGTAKLINGEVFIPFSDHFRIVINPATMTVSTSPNDESSKGLAVIEKTANGIKVKELAGGKGNYTFDWEIKGVRKGHEDYKVLRHKSEGQATGKVESIQGNGSVLPKNPEKK